MLSLSSLVWSWVYCLCWYSPFLQMSFVVSTKNSRNFREFQFPSTSQQHTSWWIDYSKLHLVLSTWCPKTDIITFKPPEKAPDKLLKMYEWIHFRHDTTGCVVQLKFPCILIVLITTVQRSIAKKIKTISNYLL